MEEKEIVKEDTQPEEKTYDTNRVCTIKDLYISPANYIISIANSSRTKIKPLVDINNIYPLEDEIPLLDVLSGEVDIHMQESQLSALRNYFEMKRQAGMYGSFKYDFYPKNAINKTLVIDTLVQVQEDLSETNYFMDF